MRQLKKKGQQKLVNVHAENDACISFSWKYLTTNKNFTFDYFNDMRAELTAREALSELLISLSQKTWVEAFMKARFGKEGIEQIPAEQLKFQPKNLSFLSNDKVTIFKFGKGTAYRLIGMKFPNIDTFYIVGYDFDFSAYDH